MQLNIDNGTQSVNYNSDTIITMHIYEYKLYETSGAI